MDGIILAKIKVKSPKGLILVLIRENTDLAVLNDKLFEKGGFKDKELKIELSDYLIRRF